MNQRTAIALSIVFPLYLVVITLTNFSLTGFWTDLVFSIALSILAMLLVFKYKSTKTGLTIAVRITNMACVLAAAGFLLLRLNNPFIADTFKLRSFYFQTVDGRLFNAYFKPVGAYSGGEGNFWITESPMYFPIIEWPVYYDRTVHWNFREDIQEGVPADNYAVVRRYIREYVIEKGK